ncbi:MAG: choice-of-anchor Q domain-containing protein [Candidatus Binatia bacterium]
MRQWLRVWMSAVMLVIASQAASAATFTVDSTVDKVDAKPGDGRCATDVGQCTLRAAIQEANEGGGGTIVLGPGTYTLSIKPDGGLPLAATGDLDVYGALTIDGADAKTTIIDGGAVDRVVSVQVAARVTISDVTIRNGKAPAGEDGGGIENYGDLTLTDVVVSGNQTQSDNTESADAPGGGICNAATLQLRNCTITGNRAADVGGGLHNKGILSMMMTTVSQNTTGTDKGGGVSNFNKATIILSTIAGNTAVGAGGGIENAGGMTLTHSTISGNTGENGGGIHNVGDLHMTDATIALNTARKSGGAIVNEQNGSLTGSLKGNGLTIAANKAADRGGVVTITPATLKLANSILAGNIPGACGGVLLSAGYNLIQDKGCRIAGSLTGVIRDTDPKLGPLADNGGPTQTMALLAGSPAIHAGNPATPGSGKGACEQSDQRGIARPSGVACDVGAFELGK